MNCLHFSKDFDLWNLWWLETIWDYHERLHTTNLICDSSMKLMPSGARIANVPGEEWAPQTATYFSRCCRAEGACSSRYLTFLVVKLDFIRIIAYNTMQHHPAWSTQKHWLPKSLGRCIFCSCREYPCCQRIIVSNWGNFQTCYVWFSQCICRKTWMYIVDRNPSLAISNQRWDGDSVTTHGVQELCRSKTSSLNIFPSHMFSLICGICSMWIFGMTLWCMDQTADGWFGGQGHWQFGTPPKRWWSAAKWRWREPCAPLPMQVKLLGGLSLVSFETLTSSNPSVQTWNLLMDENDEK